MYSPKYGNGEEGLRLQLPHVHSYLASALMISNLRQICVGELFKEKLMNMK